MVKARLGTTLIFGLTSRNLALLQQGQPIPIDLTELGLSEGKVLIMYGHTEDDIAQELRQFAKLPDDPEEAPL